MSVWQALGWGGFSSAALYIGEALAGPMAKAHRATGMVMGFGAGTLLSAVAYELIPETNLHRGLGIGIGFLVGALVYYFGDRLIDQGGGGDRQRIVGGPQGGSGAAILSGRNHHAVGMGGVTEIATSAPGYSSVRPKTPGDAVLGQSSRDKR